MSLIGSYLDDMKIFLQSSTVWKPQKLDKEDKWIKLIAVALKIDVNFGGKEKE